jgi:DNA-binding NarL/FixJ family response regulator
LPRYEDADESDVFVLSGAEDLVPALVEVDGQWEPEAVPRHKIATDEIATDDYDVHPKTSPGGNARVLVADDHAVFRFGMLAMLANARGFEVVAEASTGEEVVGKAAEVRPDIVLMDIQMPGMNGIEATRKIVQANPEISVVVVTMFGDDDSVFSAMRAGARGYVLKGADAEEVTKVLRAVAEGEAYFGPEIPKRIMGFFSSPKPAPASETFPELTPREVEVLDLIARSMNNQEIASRLYLSQKTVRNHVSNVFLKLQVAGRAQATVRAREAGLGPDDS